MVDLTEHLGLAQSTVSKHLACLRDRRLVESRPEGLHRCSKLTYQEATQNLPVAAERLLGLTGDAVAPAPAMPAAQQSRRTSCEHLRA